MRQKSVKVLIWLSLVFGSLICAESTFCQKEIWKRISFKDGVTVTFPPDNLVDKERRGQTQILHLTGFIAGSIFELRMYESNDARKQLRDIQFKKTRKHYDYKVANVDVRRTSWEPYNNGQLQLVFLASDKYLYELSILAESENQTEAIQFLGGLLVDALSVHPQAIVNPTSSIVKLDQLKTSPEIFAAYSKRQTSKTSVSKFRAAEYKESDYPHKNFTRPPIILKRELPDFRATKSTRESARIIVTLLSNGDIGDIKIYSDSSARFVKACIESARRLIFIPAQLGAMNVDSTEILDFDIKYYVDSTPRRVEMRPI